MMPIVTHYRGLLPASIVAALGLAMLFGGIVTASELPVVYRRIFVPADSPATWPRGDTAFLPVESRDFDAWVAAANELPATASVSEARYEAQLVGNVQVAGRGRWQVELQSNHPARIQLQNTSFTLRNARWRGESATPARLGWWPVEDSTKLVHALEVPRAGELEFDWEVTALPNATGPLEFPFELPFAAPTQLVLDLPAGKRPVLDDGVVLESPSKPQDGGRWVLAMAPAARGSLRIEDSSGTDSPPTLATTVREELEYFVDNRGVELLAKLWIAARGPAPKQLTIVLPVGMQLIEATCGERQLKWRVAAGDRGDGPTRASIELPDDLSKGSATIALRCWGAFVVGDSLKLPTLAVDDAFWTSGSIGLTLDESLALGRIAATDCIQTAGESVEREGAAGRRLGFTAFSPQATVEVALARRSVAPMVRMGTMLDIGNPRVVGRLVADVSSERGSRHRLSADVLPGWSIDAVETVPADALGEWYVDRTQRPHVFELQLDRAVASGEPVRVVVMGRLERENPLEPLPLASLTPLAWRELSIGRNLLQLRAAERFDLEPAGPSQYLAEFRLSAAERALFAAPGEGYVCDLAAQTPGAAVRLAPKKGTYDATIQLDAALSRGRLRQTYRIECRPVGSGVDHVLVYLSKAASAPLRWVEANSGEPLVAQRMPESDPRLGGLPSGGDLWQLDLGRLYVRPFAIAATLSQSWPRRDRVPLVALPDAATQQGRVTVSSAAAELPTIVAQGMSAASLPTGTLEMAAASPPAVYRAVYRFQPARFYDASPAAELWIGPPARAPEVTRLVATEVDVESRFTEDGSGEHRATYRLENLGVRSLELTLPEGVRLEAARVDGEAVTTRNEERVVIALSPERAETAVQLELSSRGAPLASGHQLSSPLPSGPWSILHGSWRISLPHGYSIVEDDAVVSSGSGFQWRQRLFGPLARANGDRPFNPFASQDWNSLWVGISRAFSTPAQAATKQAPEVEEPMPTGWSTFAVDFVAGPPAAVTLSHRTATTAVALGVFLACAVGARLATLRGFAILLLVVAAAAVSLVLPAMFAPLGSAATLGFLVAALWQWWWRIGPRSRPALAVILTAVGLCSSTVAAPAAGPVERVLVPVDDDGKPAGTKYFVSSDFLGELIRAANKSSADDAWLIADMRCDGELVPRHDQVGLRPSGWTLTFEVEVFTRDAAIRLPLLKHEAEWSDFASVDGIPAAIEWDESFRACTVRAPEPGRRRISIAFAPRVIEEAGRQEFALTLPKIAGAIVSIAAPAELGEIVGSDVSFSRRRESDHTVWQGELGRSGHFAASWPMKLLSAGSATDCSIDQLSTLRIEPDGLSLEAKFFLRGVVDWPPEIDVAIDDGWQLVSATQIADANESPKGRPMFRVRTTPAAGNQRELTLRFRAHDVAPLGRVLVPRVELPSMRIENHWIAVAWDPAIECAPSSPPAANIILPAEFTANVAANGSAAPKIVVNAESLDPNWYLTVRQRAELSTCRDRLSLAVGKSSLRVDYLSDITPEGADHFAWSLSVPTQLTVQDVTVSSDDETIPVEWVSASPTRVQVLFSHAVEKPYRLNLVGSLPPAADGRSPLPRILPEALPTTEQVVALYRDENVLAEWQFPRDLAPVDGSASLASPYNDETRLVSAHNVGPQLAAATYIVVEPNRPAVAGETLTTVSRDDDLWLATFTGDFRVQRGELDVLRLQVPANWTGPFEVSPAAQATLVKSGMVAGAATLSIQLPQAVRPGDVLRLQVRSPLTLADGELPAAPRIKLLHAGERQDYLALPARFGGEGAVWTKRGIEPAELPPAIQPSAQDPDGTETFRIMADSMNVALRPRSTRTSSASVRLAETSVHRGPSGGMIAVTRFIIAPEGLDHCVVKLPTWQELVRTTLDGHPALVRAVDPRTWQVQLGPPNLPQTLDIVTLSTKRLQAPPQQVELERPTLEQSGQPIPIEFGLWTLRQPIAAGTPRVNGAALVTTAELAATRLDRLVGISQSATRSLIESPVVDAYSWFARWLGGLEAAVRDASSQQRQSVDSTAAIRVPQPDGSVAEAIARRDAWIDQISEIFSATEWSIASPPVVVASFDPWADVEEGTMDRVSFISDGNQNRVLVEFFPSGMTAGDTRLVLLVSLAAVAAFVVWLARTPGVNQWALHWPEAAGLVLGLVAWAAMRPSIVGLLIAAGSLILLARRIVQERKSPRHDSFNQPNSIPEEVAKH